MSFPSPMSESDKIVINKKIDRIKNISEEHALLVVLYKRRYRYNKIETDNSNAKYKAFVDFLLYRLQENNLGLPFNEEKILIKLLSTVSDPVGSYFYDRPWYTFRPDIFQEIKWVHINIFSD